jgi:hypothetical protein
MVGRRSMVSSRLCLLCGAVVDASKLTLHREFHEEVTTLRRVAEDLRSQIRRLETKLNART